MRVLAVGNELGNAVGWSWCDYAADWPIGCSQLGGLNLELMVRAWQLSTHCRHSALVLLPG